MKNKVKNFKLLAYVLFAALSACSSGGSDDGGNKAPDGSINTPVADMRIDVGDTLDFSATSNDPDGNLPLTSQWSFGVGSGIADTNSEDPGQVQFNNEGVFTVSYTVTDSLGLADPTPATRIITVGNQVPETNIDTPATDLAISVGDNINFSATSNDPDGDDPLTFLWEFGAGSGIADATTEDPGQVQFNNEGMFTVSLTVTDSLGLAGPPVTRTITVGNPPPDGVIDTPGTDLTINVGNSLNFTGTGSDPNGNQPLTYQWDFGGGAPNTTVEDPGLVQFNSTGLFTVRFIVTDSTGKVDPIEDVRVITVKNTASNNIPKSDWSLLSVTSEEIAAEDGAAVNAFDGNDNTFWHSKYLPSGDPHPHDLRISLGGTYQLLGFKHKPRQDGSTRGRTREYEFYVSMDGSNWNKVDSDSDSGTFPDSASESTRTFDPQPANFVRFVSLSEHDGGNLTTVSELSLLGDTSTVNFAPAGTIIDPSENIIINVSDTVNFDGNASDVDVPFSYLWNFGGGSGIPDSDLEDPVVQFNNEGIFNVSFTATDSRGLADPTPAERTVQVCAPPTAIIIGPVDNHIQSSTTLNIEAHSCLDSATHAGWGLRLKLKNSGGTTIKSVDNTTATFTGLAKGEYTVEATIIDPSGSEVGGTTDSVSQIGIGNYYVAAGDSITVGLQDNFSTDDISQDDRNTGGGFPPILNNQLTILTGEPHTVINRGVSGDGSADGLLLMPSILAAHPEAEFILIMYGTNDAGSLPLTKATFKGNMQSMINIVKNAGKQAYLAKIPYAKGAFTARNTLFQEFNDAIDELISSNGISVAAPDFYNHFKNNQDELADDLHPSGTGYQSMSDLWFNELK